MSLLTASLIGGILLLVGFVGGSYFANSAIAPTVVYAEFLRLATVLAFCAASVFAVSQILGAHPPQGTRGGIFLVISAIITVFFVSRAVGINTADSNFGLYAMCGLAVLLIFLSFRLLTSQRGENWMYTLEEQGWFHTHGFKKTQGQLVRRLTLLGFLIVGGSGIWSLVAHDMLKTGDWITTIPFSNIQIPLLPAVSYSVPVLLAVFIFWIGYRLINMPTFGDFLIATEAEMNKVSWSTRKSLTKDTIVVLVTVFIITTFLLIVDLFWGWLLSVKYIEVLPKTQDTKGIIKDATGQKKTEW